MKTYTPGPWHIHGVDGLEWYVLGPNTYPAPPFVCQLMPESDTIETARLIAAAPELLDALRRFLAHADSIRSPDKDDSPMMAQARAAIAKAEGTE